MKRNEKYLRKSTGRRVVGLAMLLVFALFMMGCSAEKNVDAGNKNGVEKPKLVLADVTWDSVKVHNRIAGFIIEHGYDYPKPEYQFGESLPLLQGLSKGDIDIYMEVWADNYGEPWKKMLGDGSVKDLGSNFPDAPQGWYVPTYMIKGDAERGIKAVAPDLKSVSDLPEYWELFKDAEVPGKGRFHNSTPGWECTGINEVKIASYGLNETFNIFNTGSDTAEVTTMVTAYQKGEPWLGYYWEPTWVMGKLDMTLLEEPAFDQAKWDDESDRACAYPPAKVLIGINSKLETTAPELVQFLDNYQTTLAENNDFLAYMNDYKGDLESTEAAAIYFLKKYPDTWKSWIPQDAAAKVEQALNEVK